MEPREAEVPEPPVEAENCGAGLPLEREYEPDEEPELEAVVPLPEPYVGAGPTGAELFGTATENGLFGA